MGKKEKKNRPYVVVTSCPGCKKRCCDSLSEMEMILKQERKKRRKLEKKLKTARLNAGRSKKKKSKKQKNA